VAWREAAEGDVLLVMSNGSFGGLVDKLLAALQERRKSREATASGKGLTSRCLVNSIMMCERR